MNTSHTNTLLLTTLLITSLGGCATTGVQVDANKLMTFEKGRTTRVEIEAALGRPMVVQTMPDGKSMLSYHYAHAQVRPETFLPFVGGLVGGTDVRVNAVTIFLDAQGRYESAMTTDSEYGTGVGASAAPYQPRTDQPKPQR